MATAMNSANSSYSAASSGSHDDVTNPSFQSLSSIMVQNITCRSLFIPVLKRFRIVNATDMCPPQFVVDSSGASRTHIHSLRSKIQTIYKGDSSMTDYLNSLNEISDKLAATGDSISEPDLVAYMLSGLSDEYDFFVDSIETRTEVVNADELHGLLLSKEISLQK